MYNCCQAVIRCVEETDIAQANQEFTALAEKTNVPVVTTVMGRGAIPTNHPLYIGNGGMHGAYACNMAVNECDRCV